MDANSNENLMQGQKKEIRSNIDTLIVDVQNTSDIATKAGLTSRHNECVLQLDMVVKHRMEQINLSQTKPSGNTTLELSKEQEKIAGEKLDFSINGLEKCTKELSDFISNIKSKLTGDDIYILIDNFKAYLDTLNTYQLCIVFDLFSSLLVLCFIINIIFAYYGNSFIESFDLEKKYPKIAIIIKMRRKMSAFQIFLNFMLIIIVLGLTMYVNVVTLML